MDDHNLGYITKLKKEKGEKNEIRKKILEFGKCHSHGCWNLQVRSTAEFPFRARRLCCLDVLGRAHGFRGRRGGVRKLRSLSFSNSSGEKLAYTHCRNSEVFSILNTALPAYFGFFFFFLILVERGGRLRGFFVVVAAAAVVTTSLVAPF
jgi:hypothetical protein